MLANLVVEEKNVDAAFEKWYKLMASNLLSQESRDGDVVSEIINAITVIEDPTRNIVKSGIRNMPMRYAIGEMLWYLSGNNELKEIQKFGSGWDRMSDDGVHVNSNYGWCIKKKYGFDQWEFVREELKKNANSRRAVIHIKEASNKESKDVNCTICLQFFIRDNKLHLTTYMRSNDLWMGFVYDVFQFTCMQILMSMELGIEIGSYTHIAGSLHLYKRDYEKSLENIKGEK
jgi:thymidylate synthase